MSEFRIEAFRCGEWRRVTSIRFVPDESQAKRGDAPKRQVAKIEADRQLRSWSDYHLFADCPLRIHEVPA